MEETELNELTVNDQIDLDDIESMEEIDITRFESRTGLNLQMMAAEKGHEGAMKSLINRGFDVDCEVEGNSPIEVAFANKHFNIVHKLLRANSRFPKNIESESMPEDLKIFLDTTKNFHESIEIDDEERLCSIIKANPSVKHFYSADNKSAVRVALESKKIEIYKLLISQKVYIGPHEEIFMIVRPLGRKFRRELRELHISLSKCIISKPMMAIAKNCFIGPDVPEQDENYNFIHNALHYLFKIPSVAKFLEVVAASREFRIVFDFNRDSVEYLDPTAEPYANGLFYPSGKIYIGAKDMLDPLKKFEVYGVIAHELCHYAMFLVFNNNGKSYYEKDLVAPKMLDLIVASCRALDEEIIVTLFECYKKVFYHAEIIVRAPQLLALYNETPEVLENEDFKPLLNYYESEVVPEIEKALPRVKAKFLSKNQKKIKKQQKIIFSLGAILALFLLISIPLGIWLWLRDPHYSWEIMTEEEKSNFNSSIVSYHGTQVEFGKLFKNDSEIFGRLKSEHFVRTLEGNSNLLSADLNSIYDSFVFLEWMNMTDGLRNNFLKRDVTFQGYNISFEKILNSESTAINLLRADQIRNVLKGNSFKISSKTEQKSKFSYERHFIKEDSGDSKDSKSFENIIEEVEEKFVFILSSKAGEGKSTTVRHFWFELKKKYPEKWVQYVDLKKYIPSFKNGTGLDLTEEKVLHEFLADTLLQLKDFERELFLELFISGQVVFLWDGIDEVAPHYTDFMLGLASIIKETTSNFQFISTRPQHSGTYQNGLEVESYKLRPLSTEERFEFLVLSIASEFDLDLDLIQSLEIQQDSFINNLKGLQKFNESIVSRFSASLKNSDRIFKNLENSIDEDSINNPLIVLMLAGIVTSDKVALNENLNFYKFYELFIKKKLDIIYDKGEHARAENTKSQTKSIDINQVHQVYAIELLWPDLKDELKNLRIFRVLKKVKEQKLDISRYGLLTFQPDEDFEFIHRTFAEFFFTQFLINNIEDYLEDSAVKFLPFLNSGFYDQSSDLIRKFLSSYMESEDSLPEHLKYIKSQQKLKEDLGLSNDYLTNYIAYADFAVYVKEQKILKDVNQNYIDSIYLNEESCLDLNMNWNKILTTLQKDKFKIFFSLRDTDYDTSLHYIFYNCEGETISKILLEMIETFGYDFLFQRISNKTKDDENVIMLVAKEQAFSKVWLELEKVLKEDDQKILLKSENKKSHSILEYTAETNNVDDFKTATLAFPQVFSKSEIQEFLLRKNKKGLKPLLYFQIVEDSTLKICDELQRFTKEIFDENAMNIKIFLNTENTKGKTIFDHFKKTDDFKAKVCLNNLKTLTTGAQNPFESLVMSLADKLDIEIPSEYILHITKKFDEKIISKLHEKIKISEKIFKDIEGSDEKLIDNPLLPSLIAEIAIGADTSSIETLNPYQFYEKVIDIKIRNGLKQENEEEEEEDNEEETRSKEEKDSEAEEEENGAGTNSQEEESEAENNSEEKNEEVEEEEETVEEDEGSVEEEEKRETNNSEKENENKSLEDDDSVKEEENHDLKKEEDDKFEDLLRFHQFKALELKYPHLSEELENLKNKTSLNDFADYEITQCGLITSTEDAFEFIDSTVQDFLIAQFVISNINYLQDSVAVFLPFLNSAFYDWDSNVVKIFLVTYMDNQEELNWALKYLHEQKHLTETLSLHNSYLAKSLEYVDFAFYMEEKKVLDISQNNIHGLALNGLSCVELNEAWDKILFELGKEKFKTLFSINDTYGDTFLKNSFHICEADEISQILMNMNKTFGDDMVFQSMNQQKRSGQNLLMAAAQFELFSDIWQQVEKFLEVKYKKILFGNEDEDSWSILEWTAFADEEGFKPATEVFKQTFSKSEIQEFLLRDAKNGLKPLLYFHVVEESTLETCDELQRFTKEIFDGNAKDIKMFFETENDEGTNLFSHFKKNDNMKVQICLSKFKALLSKPQKRSENLVKSLGDKLGIVESSSKVTKENLVDSMKTSGKYNESFVSKVEKTIEIGEKILKDVENSLDEDFIDDSLLTFMITEIATSSEFSSDEALNLYRLYEIFVNMKLNINSNKKEISSPSSKLLKFHQNNAALFILPDLAKHLQNFHKDLNEYAKHTISRYGILNYKDSSFGPGYKFTHKSFISFFVAQFLISKIDFVVNKAENFLPLLNSGFFDVKSDGARKFLNIFMENAKSLPKVLEYLHQQKSLNILNRELENYVAMADFVFYTEQQKILNVSQNLIYAVNVNETICADLIEAWDKILLKLGKEKFETFFLLKDTHNRPFLTESFYECNLTISQILQNVNETFDYDFAFKIINQTGSFGQNSLMKAAEKKYLSKIWPHVEKMLMPEDQKILLKNVDENSLSILEITASKDKNDFHLVLSLFARLFSEQENQEFLLRKPKEGLKPSLYFNVLKYSSIEACDHLATFTKEIFNGNAMSIKKLLNTKNGNNEQTIFTYFNIHTHNPRIKECLGKLKALYAVEGSENHSDHEVASDHSKHH